MKKMVTGLALLLAFSSTAQADDFPQSCEDMEAEVIAVGQEVPESDSAGQLEKFKTEMKEARARWQSLSAKDKEQMSEQCAQAYTQIKQLHELLKQMKQQAAEAKKK